MSKLVDRVAKAMLINDGYDFNRLDHYADLEALRAEYWSNARTAIAAMREPTPEMIAAIETIADESPEMTRFWGDLLWQAGIDAALAEKETKE